MRTPKPKRPVVKRGANFTLTGNPPLGYLNSCSCPKCGRHLFSFFDGDVSEVRQSGNRFRVSEDWNYCSKCGTPLDLSEWKAKPDAAEKQLPDGLDEPVVFE